MSIPTLHTIDEFNTTKDDFLICNNFIVFDTYGAICSFAINKDLYLLCDLIKVNTKSNKTEELEMCFLKILDWDLSVDNVLFVIAKTKTGKTLCRLQNPVDLYKPHIFYLMNLVKQCRTDMIALDSNTPLSRRDIPFVSVDVMKHLHHMKALEQQKMNDKDYLSHLELLNKFYENIVDDTSTLLTRHPKFQNGQPMCHFCKRTVRDNNQNAVMNTINLKLPRPQQGLIKCCCCSNYFCFDCAQLCCGKFVILPGGQIQNMICPFCCESCPCDECGRTLSKLLCSSRGNDLKTKTLRMTVLSGVSNFAESSSAANKASGSQIRQSKTDKVQRRASKLPSLSNVMNTSAQRQEAGKASTQAPKNVVLPSAMTLASETCLLSTNLGTPTPSHVAEQAKTAPAIQMPQLSTVVPTTASSPLLPSSSPPSSSVMIPTGIVSSTAMPATVLPTAELQTVPLMSNVPTATMLSTPARTVSMLPAKFPGIAMLAPNSQVMVNMPLPNASRFAPLAEQQAQPMVLSGMAASSVPRNRKRMAQMMPTKPAAMPQTKEESPHFSLSPVSTFLQEQFSMTKGKGSDGKRTPLIGFDELTRRLNVQCGATPNDGLSSPATVKSVSEKEQHKKIRRDKKIIKMSLKENAFYEFSKKVRIDNLPSTLTVIERSNSIKLNTRENADEKNKEQTLAPFCLDLDALFYIFSFISVFGKGFSLPKKMTLGTLVNGFSECNDFFKNVLGNLANTAYEDSEFAFGKLVDIVDVKKTPCSCATELQKKSKCACSRNFLECSIMSSEFVNLDKKFSTFSSITETIKAIFHKLLHDNNTLVELDEKGENDSKYASATEKQDDSHRKPKSNHAGKRSSKNNSDDEPYEGNDEDSTSTESGDDASITKKDERNKPKEDEQENDDDDGEDDAQNKEENESENEDEDEDEDENEQNEQDNKQADQAFNFVPSPETYAKIKMLYYLLNHKEIFTTTDPVQTKELNAEVGSLFGKKCICGRTGCDEPLLCVRIEVAKVLCDIICSSDEFRELFDDLMEKLEGDKEAEAGAREEFERAAASLRELPATSASETFASLDSKEKLKIKRAEGRAAAASEKLRRAERVLALHQSGVSPVLLGRDRLRADYYIYCQALVKREHASMSHNTATEAHRLQATCAQLHQKLSATAKEGNSGAVREIFRAFELQRDYVWSICTTEAQLNTLISSLSKRTEPELKMNLITQRAAIVNGLENVRDLFSVSEVPQDGGAVCFKADFLANTASKGASLDEDQPITDIDIVDITAEMIQSKPSEEPAKKGASGAPKRESQAQQKGETGGSPSVNAGDAEQAQRTAVESEKEREKAHDALLEEARSALGALVAEFEAQAHTGLTDAERSIQAATSIDALSPVLTRLFLKMYTLDMLFPAWKSFGRRSIFIKKDNKVMTYPLADSEEQQVELFRTPRVTQFLRACSDMKTTAQLHVLVEYLHNNSLLSNRCSKCGEEISLTTGVQCVNCHKKYHLRCSKTSSRALREGDWYCPECKSVESKLLEESNDFCEICLDGGSLMCCSKCPHAFHKACLELDAVPRGTWLCPACDPESTTTIEELQQRYAEKRKNGEGRDDDEEEEEEDDGQVDEVTKNNTGEMGYRSKLRNRPKKGRFSDSASDDNEESDEISSRNEYRSKLRQRKKPIYNTEELEDDFEEEEEEEKEKERKIEKKKEKGLDLNNKGKVKKHSEIAPEGESSNDSQADGNSTPVHKDNSESEERNGMKRKRSFQPALPMRRSSRRQAGNRNINYTKEHYISSKLPL